MPSEQRRKEAKEKKEDWRSTSSDSSSAAKKKVVIKSANMPEEVQKNAIDIAVAAFEKHSVENDVAEFIKKEFDTKHGPTWHCIVGRSFERKFGLEFVHIVHLCSTTGLPLKNHFLVE